jgi:hypothetical protein
MRLEVIGAFESSFHPPRETFCKLIYDTCGDGVLKAFNSQRPAMGACGVTPNTSSVT